MEQINNLEQPTVLDSSLVDKVNEPITEDKEVTETAENIEAGSNFGKFKNATSLLNAYNNLEKEFTKKSQRLAEALKQNEDYKSNKDSQLTGNTQLSDKEQTISSTNTPRYKESSWRVEVGKFFDNNPDAVCYKKEIANILTKDKSLAQHKDCLNLAYALAIKNNQVNPAKLLDDPNFIDQLANNEKVKERIISNYLKNIVSNRSNIRFITGEPKSISPTPPKDKPKNLKEASNILKKLLQS